MDPSDSQLYLLETVPGRQYRVRLNSQNTGAAHLHFLNLAEEHANPTSGNAIIKAILGRDYDPRYQNLLRYIPSDHFLHIDKPCLGQGQNGVVHGAILRQPEPALCATLAFQPPFDGPGLPVVVKRIKPKSSTSREISAILREVWLVHDFALLLGNHL
jgi:hypothetical protein